MKIWALLWADLERDFFGGAGSLADELAGRPALAHTLARLSRVRGLDGIALAAPPGQVERVREIAGDVRVMMLSYEPSGPTAPAIRTARSFGRYGWRGGLGGTTIFDELYDPALVAGALDRTGGDALLLAPAGGALTDVAWTEAMLAFHREHADVQPVAFSQAPPGLAGAVFSAKTLAELAQAQSFPGRLFAYSPSRPQRDPIAESCNVALPDELIAADRRFIADNPRGLWLCRRIMAAGGVDVDGASACRIAAELGPEPWPREATVELTTRRPIEDELRPASDRGDLPIAELQAALAPLAEAGDVNIMFAGAGDALLHPRWPEAVAAAKAVGRVGLATYGTSLDASVGRRLIDSGVDVLQVYADAVSDEVYAAHKCGATAREVWANIEAFCAQRAESGAPGPFVVPSMLKTTTSLHEQDAFFDRCLRLSGWGLIIEPSDGAGQGPDRAVVHMAPPVRTPCRRIGSRLLLLADGSVVCCEEDIHGRHPLGRGDLLACWRGEALAELRARHAAGRWADHPLCAGCREFHRP